MQMDKGWHSVFFLERSFFLKRARVTPLNGLLPESRSEPIECERQPMRPLMLHEGFPLIVKQRELRSPLVRWRFQVVHANGHCAKADTSPETTEEQALEMRIEIRFPPCARIEELMLGDLDVIAMSNRQLQMPTDAALPSKRPA